MKYLSKNNNILRISNVKKAPPSIYLEDLRQNLEVFFESCFQKTNPPPLKKAKSRIFGGEFRFYLLSKAFSMRRLSMNHMKATSAYHSPG